MSVPWVYVRRVIAARWHCKPREVDDEPIDEVRTELRLMAIESEASPRRT